MISEILDFIKADEDWSRYIRKQPYWYRKLTRNPEEKEAFELAAMQHFKKTIPDKVEKFKNQLAVASIMIDMFQYMKQQKTTELEGKTMSVMRNFWYNRRGFFKMWLQHENDENVFSTTWTNW